MLLTERAESAQRLSIFGDFWGKPARALYAFLLAISVSIWFLAIRAPLWLDETGSYWQISAGFKGIWPRRVDSLCFPAYSYILWFSTKLLGTSESAMRIPSILAMGVAAYLLYRIAHELFEWDIAAIATIIFCLNPIVIHESLDVRPYAFAVLATNAAILTVVRLRRVDSDWLAALLGLLAALIVWFHYLFGAILPALLLGLWIVRGQERRPFWRPFSVAVGTFAMAMLPAIQGLLYLFRTGRTHVFEDPPYMGDLLKALAPGWVPLTIAVTVMIYAAVSRNGRERVQFPKWQVLFCGGLGLVTALILYGVSLATPIHLFVARHRLVAVPGISLFWTLGVTPVRSRIGRLVFCVALVTITAIPYFASPDARRHNYSWKDALIVAEKNAAVDNAPVLICSDWPESDYGTMPVRPAESVWFAPLTYYQLTVPVVPLPRSLNDQAMRIGTQFLEKAPEKRKRFLAMGFGPSFNTLNWLSQQSSQKYAVRELGIYDGVVVLEFDPVFARGNASAAAKLDSQGRLSPGH